MGFFIAISVQFAPIPDAYRWGITIAAIIGAIICIAGWLMSRDKEKSEKDGPINILGHASGTVAVAGRDAIQSVHHYHSTHSQPTGIRADASALRKFREHRDDGEEILSGIRPGDGDGGMAWGLIDSWWAEARVMAHQNVFQPFFSLAVINRFESPWPSENDKYEAVKRASIAGQIKSTDDIKLYEMHWQRLERVKELIAIIESSH